MMKEWEQTSLALESTQPAVPSESMS